MLHVCVGNLKHRLLLNIPHSDIHFFLLSLVSARIKFSSLALLSCAPCVLMSSFSVDPLSYPSIQQYEVF